MISIKKIVSYTWEKLYILFGVLGVLLPTSPLNMPLTFRDSGVFLYIGWRILNGELPYADIWDHKPPVIFYINALGLAIANHSRWGVWLIEFIALFIAAYIGYQLIKKNFGLIPAIISSLLWLLSLVPLLQGGNFTTEYTLPLQFFALWIASKINEPEIRRIDYIILGITGALAFFTKQTAIGVWLGVFIYLLLVRVLSKRIKFLFKEANWIFIGGASVTLVIVGFFWIQNTFPEFWSAAFTYNFAYSIRSDGDFISRLEAIQKGLRPLTQANLLQLAALGYFFALLQIVRKKIETQYSALLGASLLILPIELFLIAIPDKTFPHYFMTLLPVLCILSAWFIFNVVKIVSQINISQLWQYVSVIVLMGIISYNFYYIYLDQTYIYRKLRDDTGIKYIILETGEDDTVLIWGAEASVNFFTKRKSPTRFVYQYPLHQNNYVTEEMILEFLDDIIKNQPKLVINADSSKTMYEFPIRSSLINEKVATIQSQYCLIGEIDQWAVYENC
ncbi:MAG TPA: hypothetical protein DIW23_06780 [Anaerolineae bacterium]|nr:hypothetical protein [Anaerolineae bacterium]